MNEPIWKLGADMHREDTILDEITFRHIIDALHCNEIVLDEDAVFRVVKEILDGRIQDFMFLIGHNVNEIIAEVAKGRN